VESATEEILQLKKTMLKIKKDLEKRFEERAVHRHEVTLFSLL
jgi:hypothetical protein